MKTSWGKFLNLAHYFPYHVKLRLLAHSRSFLARSGIDGAENLLNINRRTEEECTFESGDETEVNRKFSSQSYMR